MSRPVHADTLAILPNADMEMFYLFTFEFSTLFRLTDHSHDITYNFGAGSETFSSTGRIANYSNSEETLDLSNQTMTVELTGANAADISLALTENFNNKRVVIRRGFFNGSGETTDSDIVADPYIFFDGRVDSYTISDDPETLESKVSWKIASHWADWEKVNGRKCNNQNANEIINPATGVYLFPNEDGFNHVYDQIGDKIWGKVLT